MSKSSRRVFTVMVSLIVAAATTFNVLAQANLTVTIGKIDDSQFPNLSAPLTTLDLNGVPVSGLGVTAFQAQEDNQPLTITSVEPFPDAQAPLALVLAIDLSSSMTGKPLDDAKAAATALIDQLGSNDRMAIIGFNGKVDLSDPLVFDPQKEIDFTTDKTTLRTLVDGLKATGATPLYDAGFKAIRLLTKRSEERHAVILMTDGKDDPGSTINVDDLINKAQNAHVPIFTIGFGAQADLKNLDRIAVNTTGSSSLAANDADELRASFQNVFSRMKLSYRLKARSQLAPDGKTHAMAVNVTTSSGSAQVSGEFVANPTIIQIIAVDYTVQGQTLQLKDGIEFKGIVPISTTISSKARVKQVDFIVDEKTPTPVIAAPWAFEWNTCKLEPGTHILRIHATDDQNQADEKTFNVTTVNGDILTCGFGPFSPTVVIVAGGALLLLVIILIIVVIARSRRQPEPAFAAEAVITEAPIMMPPPPPATYAPPPPQPTSAYAPPPAPLPAASQTRNIGLSGNGDASGSRAPAKTEVLEQGPKVLAWLIIEQGPHAGKEFRLSESTTLGRDPAHCDITLDDSAISGQHAKVKLEDKQFYLWDLASTNHTFVRTPSGDWEQIMKHPLTDGTRLKLGATVMVFKQA